MLFPAPPGCFLERCLSGQVGLRTEVVRKSVWAKEGRGLVKKGTRCCVRSEVLERWLVGVAFLSGTCYSVEGGSGGNCCADIWVVTQSSSGSDCHPADSSVLDLPECPPLTGSCGERCLWGACHSAVSQEGSGALAGLCSGPWSTGRGRTALLRRWARWIISACVYLEVVVLLLTD